MQDRLIIKQRDLSTQLLAGGDLNPLLRRIMAARGVQSQEELDYRLQRLPHFDLFSQMPRATNMLADAVMSQQAILIVGDYDADGATSTALGVRALKMMGTQNVRYFVPNRFEHGYGLSVAVIEAILPYAPDVLITVDNGICSVDGVRAAKAAGIRVLITDHHLPGNEWPPADAIINPNLPGESFPGSHLAGVGVIFYVMLGLRHVLRTRGWFSDTRSEPKLSDLLDLVALGTVADVVKLDTLNRILVEQGLRRIRAGKCIPGIAALLELSGKAFNNVVASDLGFVLGPRLNAAGRLGDMSLGIECLIAEQADVAMQCARILDEMNQQRKEIEREMHSQALDELQALGASLDTESLPAGLCLYDERWHEGVIGILASRIKDIVHRPVITFANASDTEIKGSARSIQGVHIRDVIAAVANENPGLIHKFGGHAMAAGLSLSRTGLPEFQKAFATKLEQCMDDETRNRVLLTDGALAKEELNSQIAEMLRYAGPWGQGFPEPLFEGVFTVQNFRIVGGAHVKFNLGLSDYPASIDAIAFNDTGQTLKENTQLIRAVYQLDINEFNGNRKLQLLLRYYEPVDPGH